MIWWQSECKYGDMIRVSFGSFYHYGIFVSDGEVIQFGLPPVEGLMNRKFDEISVCITDIDTFSMGKIVEVASPEKGDKLKRLSPHKTVSRAKACIGEKGYNILHNNCEHFARYCYLGEKRCEVTEQVIADWNKKTKCDIYFSKIPEGIVASRVFPPERNHEIFGVNDEYLSLQKYWSWKTLEYALFRSFGYKITDLTFSKAKNDKWMCDKCFFSIARSNGYVAVAVSNAEVGIDMEETRAFCEKCNDEAFFKETKRSILAKKETAPQSPEALLTLLTQKESIFKRSHKKRFKPAKIQITEDVSSFKFTHEEAALFCSASGSDIKKSFFYYYDGAETSKIKDIVWI